MKRIVVRFALWLLRKCRYEPIPTVLYLTPFPDVTDRILEKAKAVVGGIEHTFIKEASGEARRHSALSRLMKEFPNVSERTIAAAIELAVRKVKV